MNQYYSILGLQPSASKSEIKRAFRRLAKMYHPDRNKSLEARKKFMQIYQAYDTLINAPNSTYTSSPKKEPKDKKEHGGYAQKNNQYDSKTTNPSKQKEDISKRIVKTIFIIGGILSISTKLFSNNDIYMITGFFLTGVIACFGFIVSLFLED